jgi:hypothetical protein
LGCSSEEEAPLEVSASGKARNLAKEKKYVAPSTNFNSTPDFNNTAVV